MHTTHYEVIVRGCLGPALISAFDGLTPTTTALSPCGFQQRDYAA